MFTKYFITYKHAEEVQKVYIKKFEEKKTFTKRS